MKKIMFAALVAGMFMCVSCSSNVDKVIDLKKEQAEAVKELDLKKAAELEKEVAAIMKEMSAWERRNLEAQIRERDEIIARYEKKFTDMMMILTEVRRDE